MLMLVDYGKGNIFSLSQALRHIGQDFKISDKPEEIAKADYLILPGVGAFGDAAQALKSRGLDQAVKERVRQGYPLLGICVGCQLLLDVGEEFGVEQGLSLLAGSTRRLPEGNEAGGMRIPNVGWRVTYSNDLIFRDLAEEVMLYFVHSYAPHPTHKKDILAHILFNDVEIPVAIGNDNILGFQFHPEKSGSVGLEILRRALAKKI